MKNIYTDRSRTETAQRCARLRFLEYHQSETGIRPVRKSLPLVVGGAVHTGLEHLLREGQRLWDRHQEFMLPQQIEDMAVEQALTDFRSHLDGGIDLEVVVADKPAEQAGGIRESSFAELTYDDEAVVLPAGVDAGVFDGFAQYQKYLEAEQAALVEALVRAYARRRLRPLLDAFEVLEVEREGTWKLGEYDGKPGVGKFDLWWMSRPDAILREKATGELWIMSFKTAASWDRRKDEDAKHDMQGLSEGVEVEQRLGEWWQHVQDALHGDPELYRTLNAQTICDMEMTPGMRDWLHSLPAPPRIHGIRYEYMLKGERWVDKELSAKLGFEARVQKSHLVRPYLNAGMVAGDEQWCWSWDYVKPDGATSKLYYKNWHATAIWEHKTVKAWIDALDTATSTQANEADALDQSVLELGYSCDAQSCGTTKQHPLDSLFLPPIPVYRNDDDLRDWVEQVEAQELRVNAAVIEVERTADEDERRHLLNVLFPQTRRACAYPTTCAMVKVCYGGTDIRKDPLASGMYKRREPNHPQEKEAEHVR